MKWTVGVKIGSTFALAWLLLLLIGFFSYRNTVQLIETAGLVSHTNQVRFELADLLSHVQDAETGQRGYVMTGQERYLEPYTAGVGQTKGSLQRVRQLTADNPNQQRRLDAIEQLIGQKFDELNETIELRRNKGLDAALKVVLTDRGKTVMDQIRKVSSDMDKEESDLQGVRDTRAKATAENTKLTILLGTLGAFVALLICAVLLTRDIARPLGEVSAVARRIASGDLSVHLPANERRDEVGELTRSFARMVESLTGMAETAKKISAGDLTVAVRPQSEGDVLGSAFSVMVANLREVNLGIRESVSVLTTSASQILAATTEVAAGAAETASAVGQTTATVEEVKQTAQLSSDKARFVSETAQKTVRVSHVGKKSVEETMAAMNRISEQMDLVAEGIIRLSEQGQAIGEIMATVNDLAEQSNLLAVNAAIEAAKAGDQGKGFAVVAQEVKSLAHQSKQATAQVRTILGDFQKATNNAVMATEQGSKAVEAGMKQSVEAGESIRMLTDSISEATQAATQIAASNQQQQVGMNQVAQAMESIKLASVQNVASTKQGEAAALNLNELAQRMKLLVAQYKV